jgi:hypothetical protein
MAVAANSDGGDAIISNGMSESSGQRKKLVVVGLGMVGIAFM